MSITPDVQAALLQHGGVIRAADHPRLRRTIYRLAGSGELLGLYPGVFVAADLPLTPEMRIRAAAQWGRAGVVTGRAAARLTFWPDLPVWTIGVAGSSHRLAPPGIEHSRMILPAEATHVCDGIRLTRPARTVVDLLPDLGGAAISQGLRSGVRMDELWAALDASPCRRGNRRRRRMLHRYRDKPWSEAEQKMHEILRRAGITGWIANYPCRIAGRRRFLDIVFEEQGVVIEIDGYETHSAQNRAQFERDRFTANWLTARGWLVLRFTWLQIVERPDWVRGVVRRTLEQNWGHHLAPRLPR